MRSIANRWTLLVAALAIVKVLSLSAPAVAEERSKTNLKIAIFSSNGDVATIHTMMDAATEDAKSRGWTVETFDGRGDLVAVNNQANTYITRGFDALINVASPNDQMTGVIAKAKKANIPFVSCFAGMAPNITVDIGDNNVVDGAIAAAELAARINGQGTVAKLNWNVAAGLRERDRGFQAVMAGFPGVKVKDIEVKVPGEVEDAYTKTINLLQADSDHEVKAIWTGSDNFGRGVARAVQKSKRDDVFVVSMDGDDAGLAMLRQHTPFAITVGYDIPGMGRAAVQAVADTVDGKSFVAHQMYKKPCLFTPNSVPPEGTVADYKTCGLFSADMK
jgi:ribose transport system substrate-binding protein